MLTDFVFNACTAHLNPDVGAVDVASAVLFFEHGVDSVGNFVSALFKTIGVTVLEAAIVASLVFCATGEGVFAGIVSVITGSTESFSPMGFVWGSTIWVLAMVIFERPVFHRFLLASCLSCNNAMFGLTPIISERMFGVK